MEKNMIWIRKAGYLGICVMMIFSALALINSQNTRIMSKQKITTIAGQPIVIMELFTSQGCSSCPPADALLAEYAASHDERIIPLSFHVDYWNRLGWTDPFSKQAYSARQQWYSEYFPKHSVYTPQLVVNGKAETVGNNRNAVKNLVQKELSVIPSASISIGEVTIGNNIMNFHYQTANSNEYEVLNIALVQKQVTTNIKAGENEGITIINHNIVRSFITQPLSNDGSGSISLPPAFKVSDYALVLFIQNKKDRSVKAALRKEL